MIIGNPMVVFLNRRSSSGMCHGIAAMIIISIVSDLGRITEKDIVFTSASI
jgi:hypothetical protein